MKQELKWQCNECKNIIAHSDLIIGISPFSKSVLVTGCPECHTMEDFTELCDEAGCNENAVMGFKPKTGNYRRTCNRHSGSNITHMRRNENEKNKES